ncbi:DUF1573 domain-containing protein [Verrucomicrobiaceae bacterium N1E253]|uniref:DUF1573 domain-containing protein n=1 Tax=Oceaniferula marina TaxID=2748318 RepID=A0A851GJR5_9BACT|nr:DUF1573 domain-containing protein [Oceaniferula marina]NWK57576.1 DUF1573 domain-containing protein [Oceaniferula marina]
MRTSTIATALMACLAFCLCSSVSLADRGFSFVQNRIAVTVKPEDKLVSIPFEFENKTKRTITIARYDSACSCISARVTKPLGKMTYKPGEKGQITVDFELKNFQGLQEKTLLLWTKDDPAEAPSSVLTSAITIPELFKVEPKTLFWEQNGEKTAKTFKITIPHDQPIKILELEGSNQQFPYTLKTITEGREYEISVTPTDVSSPSMGVIKLTTDSKIPRYRRHQAFVCVRRPELVKPKPVTP